MMMMMMMMMTMMMMMMMMSSSNVRVVNTWFSSTTIVFGWFAVLEELDSREALDLILTTKGLLLSGIDLG